eukprot:s988_g9.t1
MIWKVDSKGPKTRHERRSSRGTQKGRPAQFLLLSWHRKRVQFREPSRAQEASFVTPHLHLFSGSREAGSRSQWLATVARSPTLRRIPRLRCALCFAPDKLCSDEATVDCGSPSYGDSSGAVCAVEGVDKGRERDIGEGTRGGSADGALEGGDKGRERDIGCADGARWRAWESCGLPFCQYSLCLGFRVPGLTLFPPHLFGGAQATRRQAAAVGGRLRGARASSRRELKEGSSGGSLGSNRQLGRTGSHQQPEEGGGFLTPLASNRDAEDDEAAVACTEQLGVSLPAFALRCSGQSNPRLCIGFRMQQAFMQKQGDKSSIYGGRPLHTTLIRFFFFPPCVADGHINVHVSDANIACDTASGFAPTVNAAADEATGPGSASWRR